MGWSLKKFINLTPVILFGFLVACSSKVEDKSELAASASFDIAPITVTKVDPINNESNIWTDLALSKRFTLNTCLTDNTLQIPIQNVSVEVTTPFGQQEKTTNANGCFTWSDTFTTRPFGQESLSPYNVIFKVVRGHVGTKTIPLLINADTNEIENSVYDTRFDGSPQTIKALEAETGVFHLRNINIQYIESGYNQESDQGHSSFRFVGSVSTRQVNLLGNPYYRNLIRGHFDILISLIEERQGQFFKISSQHFSNELNEGLIQKTLSFNYDKGFQHHSDAKFYLIIELAPKDLPAQFSQYSTLTKGVLPLLSFNGNSEGNLQNISDFSEELIHAPTKEEFVIAQEEKSGGDIRQIEPSVFGVEISEVQLGHGALKQNTLSSTARTRQMPVDICLTDTLNSAAQGPLKHTKIAFKAFQADISDTDEVREVTTNSLGCFQTFLNLKYDYLECEKFHSLDYVITILDGRFADLSLKGGLAINPHNPSDLFYDLTKTDSVPHIACEKPQLIIPQFNYKSEGISRSDFKINKHLSLSLKKNYHIDFTPQFFRGESFQELENFQNLYEGKLNVEFSLFSPRKAESDYYSFDESEWEYITSAQNEIQINATGMAQGQLKVPLNLSDTIFLGFKGLLVVTVSPKDHDKLKKTTFAVPFYATAEGGSLPTVPLDFTPSVELSNKIAIDLENGLKIPGVYPGRNTVEGDLELLERKPIELYREKLLTMGQKHFDNFTVIPGSNATFNAFPPVGKTSWDEVSTRVKNTYYTELRDVDFTTFTTRAGRIPVHYLNKFCRLFYPVTGNTNNIDACLAQPSEHIDLLPMTFIEEIRSGEQEINFRDSLSNEHSMIFNRADFLSDEIGSIKRGNAYFAASGDRSSIDWGERESQSSQRSFSYGLDGPSMMFIGTSATHQSVEETYKVKNTSEMRAAFNRNYTSRDIIDLSYNSLTLQFIAEKRDCFTLTSKKKVPLAYNFCRKETQLKTLEETWFLLMDTNAQSHGIISDGNLKGDKTRTQIIRGQHNFNKLWDQFESSDALLVIRELGNMAVGDAFDKYYPRNNSVIPFENRFNHSFPGMIIPSTHTPTTSCSDCQDQ